jgi:hypothetical protein
MIAEKSDAQEEFTSREHQPAQTQRYESAEIEIDRLEAILQTNAERLAEEQSKGEPQEGCQKDQSEDDQEEGSQEDALSHWFDRLRRYSGAPGRSCELLS